MKRNLIIYLLVIFSIFSLYGCGDIFQFLDDNVTDSNNNINGHSNGSGGNTDTDGNGNSNGSGGDTDTDGNGNSNGSGGDTDTDGNGNSNGSGGNTDTDGDGNSNGSGGNTDTDGNGNSNGSGGDTDTDGNGNSNGSGGNTDTDGNGNSNGSGGDTDTDGNGNSNGNGGDTDTDGSGDGENSLNKLRHLFLTGFGDNPNGMYFALHITGKSKTGIFAQKGTTMTYYIDAYARDLELQLKEDNGATGFEFSKAYSNLGLSDVYDINYGWTDKDGLNLDMPFYLGFARFYIPENSINKNFVFKNFAIEDMTVKTQFMGKPVMVRCNDEDLNFKIPLDKYNPNIHKNIALLTIEFRNTECTDYTVTFDGFVEQ